MTYDWLGNLIVPALSALAGGLVAVWIAFAGVRHAHRQRLREAVGELIATLSAVAVAATQVVAEQAKGAPTTASLQARSRALDTFGQGLNRAVSVATPREVPPLKYAALVMANHDSSVEQPEAAHWVAARLAAWMQGAVTIREFEKNMPRDQRAWITDTDLRVPDSFA